MKLSLVGASRAVFLLLAFGTGLRAADFTRRGDSITGEISPDGRSWTEVGTTTVSLKHEVSAGQAACSRVAVSTTVMFDHVSVTGASR